MRAREISLITKRNNPANLQFVLASLEADKVPVLASYVEKNTVRIVPTPNQFENVMKWALKLKVGVSQGAVILAEALGKEEICTSLKKHKLEVVHCYPSVNAHYVVSVMSRPGFEGEAIEVADKVLSARYAPNSG